MAQLYVDYRHIVLTYFNFIDLLIYDEAIVSNFTCMLPLAVARSSLNLFLPIMHITQQ